MGLFHRKKKSEASSSSVSSNSKAVAEVSSKDLPPSAPQSARVTAEQTVSSTNAYPSSVDYAEDQLKSASPVISTVTSQPAPPPSPAPPRVAGSSTVAVPIPETTKPGEAKTEAAPAAAAAVPAAPKPPAKFTFTLDQVAQAGFVACIVFQLLLFKIFSPSFLATCLFITIGFGTGMGLSYLFYQNKKRKLELSDVLSQEIGMKGLQCLVKDLPSWVSVTEREKMEWMNKLLEEMWPFYDRAICQAIKDAVEPMLDMYKPPGIKKIFFKQLTFGDSPFRIEDIYVEPNTVGEVVMEVTVRWCGQANIQIAVDLPTGGEATRMCPKVSDISFVGTTRIAMRPLMDVIPAFGALMVSLKRPPIIKFDLDFGKALGGGMSAGMVRNFIDPFLRETLVDMLVWPNRITIPIIWNDPVVDAEVAKMQLRNVGLLRVTVDSAKGLKAYDMNGKSDPMVELYIDPKHKKVTSVKKSTLEPLYGETFYLLVQEPRDQFLRIVVSDVDLFNAKDMLTIKVWKIHEAINSKTFMGRSAIQVRPICEREGEEVAASYALGRGDWSDVQGPGKGEGTIHLTCLYRPFHSISVDECRSINKGVVVIELEEVKNLEITKQWTPFYVELKCSGKTERSPVFRAQGDRKTGGNLKFTWGHRFVFDDVQVDKDLHIIVCERSAITADDVLGRLDPIPVAVIADSADNGEAGLYAIDDRATEPIGRGGKSLARSQLMEADKGNIYCRLRFVPYF